MRLLITGASGYVGARVLEAAPSDWTLHGQWRSHQPPPIGEAWQCDLDDGAAVSSLVREARPDVVLHCAYEMAAGAEPNLRWSRNVLNAAGARMILMSTDLVFDGKRGWYREDEPQDPTVEYGVWKAQLERETLATDGIVVRTSLVWGLEPANDSVERLVLQPLRDGQTPRLFEDEWRTPTEVHELAAALVETCQLKGPRILHLSGPERISRLDFGRAIAKRFGYDPEVLPPFKRAEIAPSRPADTSLAITSLTRDHIKTAFHGPTELLSVPSSR